jgi:hypothetical protein
VPVEASRILQLVDRLREALRGTAVLALALGVPFFAASAPGFALHIFAGTLLLLGIALVIYWRIRRVEPIADLRVSMRELRVDPEGWKSRLGGSIRSVYSARVSLRSYASYLLDQEGRVAVLEQSPSPEAIAENGRWAADLLGVPFDPHPAGGPNLRIAGIIFVVLGLIILSASTAYEPGLLGLGAYVTTIVGFLLLYWALTDR